jgi:hypothetical protein
MSRVIDLRTYIVILIADAARTSWWSASGDGETAAAPGGAVLWRVAESALIAKGNA